MYDTVEIDELHKCEQIVSARVESYQIADIYEQSQVHYTLSDEGV